MSARKVDKEGRLFNNEWKLSYFVRLHSDSGAICVICATVIAVLKEYNIKRHYATRHSGYDQYTGKERTEKYDSLNKNLQQQQSTFTRYKDVSEKATKVSFRISDVLGQKQLPFCHGEFAKEVIIMHDNN